MEIENSPLPPRPPMKVFKPKVPELEVLKNYGVAAKESYWTQFPVNRNLPFKTAPEKATVCSLQTKPKPKGDTRIIVNSSCPKGKSVYDCIDKNKYPAYMGGIKEFIVALNFCGHQAKICKVDWKGRVGIMQTFYINKILK